jgi:hypothetical protein
MLQLTLKSGEHVLVDPAHVGSVKTQGDVTVVYQPGDENPWRVTETVYDIARLKAAWEQRFGARELRGSLPIAVAFETDETGRGAIMFKCCAVTQALREEREAARALSRRRFLGFGRR